MITASVFSRSNRVERAQVTLFEAGRRLREAREAAKRLPAPDVD